MATDGKGTGAGRRTVHLVPSTHWDREWYRVLGEFQFHFAETMDLALALLDDGQLASFHTDGQSSVVEEYLAARPGALAQVRRLAQHGRLEIGPWYTQSDMLLPSGESLIRNLELGAALARGLGAAPGIPYSPDAFGHMADVPKMLRHLGFDAYFFCRGLGEQLDPPRSEFRWRSDDGSEILAIAGLADVFDPPYDRRGRWICGAYALGMALPEGEADFAERMRLIEQHAARYAMTGQLLAINGSDHLLPQAHAAAAIVRFNRAGRGLRCHQGTLAGYVRALRAGLAGRRLPAASGELVDGRFFWILAGTGSSRAGLKRDNWLCQHLLEGWIEPWQAFLPRLLGRAQAPFLDQIWRLLLQNQSHDCICGCGIDAMHREMATRYETIRRLGARLLLRAVRQAAGDRRLPYLVPADGDSAFPLLLCSGLPWRSAGPWLVQVQHPKDLDLADCEFRDQAGREIPAAPVATTPPNDTNGPFLPAGPLGAHLATTTLALDGPELAGYGFQVVECRRRKVRRPIPAAPRSPVLDNGVLRVALEPGGTLAATFRHGGRTLRCPGLLEFEDEADVGGEYHFRPIPGDRPLRPAPASLKWRWRLRTPFVQVLEVDRWIDCPIGADRAAGKRLRRTAPLKLRSVLTLRRGAACLEIRTEVDNPCGDHRLRAVFPLPFRVREYEAQTQFGRLAQAVARPRGEDWAELPVPHRRHYGWLAFRDPRRKLGVALLPQGIHEHETDADAVRLTLLRCVGEIGYGGPALASPDAQCLGTQICEYALRFFAGPEAEASALLEREMLGLARQPRAWTLHPEALGARSPREQSFLELRSERLVLSSVRPGPAAGTMLVRLYNPTGRKATGELRSGLGPLRAWTVSHAPGIPPRRGRSVNPARLAVPAHGIAAFAVDLLKRQPREG